MCSNGSRTTGVRSAITYIYAYFYGFSCFNIDMMNRTHFELPCVHVTNFKIDNCIKIKHLRTLTNWTCSCRKHFPKKELYIFLYTSSAIQFMKTLNCWILVGTAQGRILATIVSTQTCPPRCFLQRMMYLQEKEDDILSNILKGASKHLFAVFLIWNFWCHDINSMWS